MTIRSKHGARVVLSLLACGWIAPAWAQPGVIAGRVTDASGEFGFGDAVIVIEELERRTRADRGGRFRFGNVPAGNYTVRAEYVGADTGSAPVQVTSGETVQVAIAVGADLAGALENVLVIGQAAGQAAAISRRRADETIVNVLSSDSVGDFPDQNVAEALQRVPGISVQRDQGEGRFAVIRGIDPQFNTTNIDGVRVPGTEAGARSVNLDVISSDLIESVEIHKAITPDMDGDAVGGNVDINTLTAFDVGGRSLSFSGGAAHNTQIDETSPKLSGLYTDLFSVGGETDNLGITVAFSSFDRDFGSDNIEGADGWFPTDTPAGGEVRALEEAEQRDYIITRDRSSLSVNVDFRPNDADSFYARTLYSEFAEKELKIANVYKFADGDILTLDADSGTFGDATIEKESADSNKVLEIFAVSFGGRHERDRWAYDYSVGYSEAGEAAGDPELVGLFVNEGVGLGYDVRGDFQQPRYFGTDAGATDATRYALDEIVLEDVANETREMAFEFNARRETSFGGASGYWQLGLKSRLQESDNDIEAWVYEDFGAFTAADFQGPALDYPPRGDFGPAIDYAAFRAFFNANRSGFTLNEADSAIDSRAEDYDLEEAVHSAYVMANADFDRLSLLGGVRVEYTDYSAVGTQVLIDEETGSGEPVLTDFAGDNDYTDVFPSLHLRYRVSDQSILRAALTRSIARPSFEAISPRQNLEITDEGGGEFERVAEVGNPSLEPLRSSNLDLRWEYYPSGVSTISAGAFYKQIDDFFIVADVSGQGPFVGFDEVVQTINGDSADLFGIELEYVRQFASLPAPWNGLLLMANYTYTDSEANLPQRASSITLPGQSEHIGNFAIGFDSRGLSLRLAATFRSEFFEEAADLEDPAFDRYQDDHLQLDLTAKYRFNDALQLYFNAVNLTDEPLYAYFADPRFNSQYEEYGASYEVGMKVDF